MGRRIKELATCTRCCLKYFCTGSLVGSTDDDDDDKYDKYNDDDDDGWHIRVSCTDIDSAISSTVSHTIPATSAHHHVT